MHQKSKQESEMKVELVAAEKERKGKRMREMEGNERSNRKM